jgi:hypothetical protein
MEQRPTDEEPKPEITIIESKSNLARALEECCIHETFKSKHDFTAKLFQKRERFGAFSQASNLSFPIPGSRLEKYYQVLDDCLRSHLETELCMDELSFNPLASRTPEIEALIVFLIAMRCYPAGSENTITSGYLMLLAYLKNVLEPTTMNPPSHICEALFPRFPSTDLEHSSFQIRALPVTSAVETMLDVSNDPHKRVIGPLHQLYTDTTRNHGGNIARRDLQIGDQTIKLVASRRIEILDNNSPLNTVGENDAVTSKRLVTSICEPKFLAANLIRAFIYDTFESSDPHEPGFMNTCACILKCAKEENIDIKFSKQDYDMCVSVAGALRTIHYYCSGLSGGPKHLKSNRLRVSIVNPMFSEGWADPLFMSHLKYFINVHRELCGYELLPE